MELALTFGSVGDIIAVCQLCVQLGRALGWGCKGVAGSAKEYQELRKDLDLFVQILLQVVATYQQRENSNSTYLTELDRTTKTVVEECAALIKEALEHFGERYNSSLQAEGSGSRCRDVYKKLEWRAREKERLLELREKLHRNTERLSLLNGLAARTSARIESSTMLARMDEVQRLVSAEASQREEMLRLLKEQHAIANIQADRLDAVNDRLATQSQSTYDMSTSLKHLLTSVTSLMEALGQVASVVTAVKYLVSAPSSMFLRFLDPTKELPVVVEDALGRRLTIPPAWIEFLEWDTFHRLLEDHSKGQRGQDMVRRRQYTLEEDVTGNDVDQNMPPTMSLRRGMKINMSMAFAVGMRQSGICPRCRTDNSPGPGAADRTGNPTIHCKKEGCGMSFRMTNAAPGGDRAATEAALKVVFGYLSQPPPAATGSGARSDNAPPVGVQATPANPSDFLRVRLLLLEYKRAQVRRHGSLSEDRKLRVALWRKLGSCDECRARRVKCTHHDLSLFEAAYLRSRQPQIEETESERRERPSAVIPTLETQELYNRMRQAQERVTGSVLSSLEQDLARYHGL